MIDTRKLALQFLFGIALCLPGVCGAEDKVSEIISPNRKFKVMFTDGDTNRTIRLVSSADGETVFEKSTVLRHSLACWNTSSDRCAIVDAPDNANTELVLLVLAKDGGWSKQKFDLLQEVAAKSGVDSDLGRGGVESMRWTSKGNLWCDVVYENISFDMNISTDQVPFSISVSFANRDWRNKISEPDGEKK